MKGYIKNAQNSLIAYALKSINSELYEICKKIPEPMLINFSHIGFIHSEFQKQFGEFTAENKTLFIACIYRLYNCTHLYGTFNKMPHGLRDKIASVLGFVNAESVNGAAFSVPAHYKNARTAKKINDFAECIHNILKERGDLANEELTGVSAHLVFNIKKFMDTEQVMPKNPL